MDIFSTESKAHLFYRHLVLTAIKAKFTLHTGSVRAGAHTVGVDDEIKLLLIL